LGVGREIPRALGSARADIRDVILERTPAFDAMIVAAVQARGKACNGAYR
jgi:hypothetical protein